MVQQGENIVIHEEHPTVQKKTTINELKTKDEVLYRMLMNSPQRPEKMAGLDTTPEAERAIRSRLQ